MHALLLHLSAKKTGCCADKCTLRVTHFRFSLLARRITAPIASLAHRTGCIISFKRITVINNRSGYFPAAPTDQSAFAAGNDCIQIRTDLFAFQFPASAATMPPRPDHDSVITGSQSGGLHPMLPHIPQQTYSALQWANIFQNDLSFPVCKISSGVPSLIRSVFRISFGITTLPRSSILRTIPVAFIFLNSSCIFCLSYVNVMSTICFSYGYYAKNWEKYA